MLTYGLTLEKGGVGKTSLAVNLAAAMDAIGIGVLVIDLDAQGHATHSLSSARPTDAAGTIIGVIEGRDPLQIIQPTAHARIKIIPASGRLVALPQLLMGSENGGLFVLRDTVRQLEAVLPDTQVVLLDLAPARGPVLQSALVAVNRCLAPIQAEEYVVESVKALSQSVASARRINPELQPTCLIRNRYRTTSDNERGYDEFLADPQTLAALDCVLLQTVIPDRAAVRQAASNRQSVFQLPRDGSKIRDIFLRVAEELLVMDGLLDPATP